MTHIGFSLSLLFFLINEHALGIQKLLQILMRHVKLWHSFCDMQMKLFMRRESEIYIFTGGVCEK